MYKILLSSLFLISSLKAGANNDTFKEITLVEAGHAFDGGYIMSVNSEGIFVSRRIRPGFMKEEVYSCKKLNAEELKKLNILALDFLKKKSKLEEQIALYPNLSSKRIEVKMSSGKSRTETVFHSNDIWFYEISNYLYEFQMNCERKDKKELRKVKGKLPPPFPQNL